MRDEVIVRNEKRNNGSTARQLLGRVEAKWCSTEERLEQRPRMLEKWIVKEECLSETFGSGVEPILLLGVSTLTSVFY